jgi:hypothetical protein
VWVDVLCTCVHTHTHTRTHVGKVDTTRLADGVIDTLIFMECASGGQFGPAVQTRVQRAHAIECFQLRSRRV